MLPPDKGGLTSTGLVYRYDTELSEDGKPPRLPSFGKSTQLANRNVGVGGREGAFSMCTFWLVEAMTRASVYEPKYLVRAINLCMSNHRL